MRKTAFYRKHRLTDAKPIDIAKRPISARDFIYSISDFLTENFRGLCTVTRHVSDAMLYVYVSEDISAYLIKLLLACVDGEHMLYIDITDLGERLSISVSSDGELPYGFDDANQLVRTATDAGFEVFLDNDRLILTTPMVLSSTLRVYATTRFMMRAKLNEIFYTGGAIVGDDG